MPTHSIAPITGTQNADTLNGTTRSEVLDGRRGNDTINGHNGNDIIFGGPGDDHLNGGAGDDVIHGSRNAVLGQFETITITEDYDGQVIWGGETAGYRNTVGMYKVDPNGQIVDVDIIWENASNQGSGGSLVIGQSTHNFSMQAGDQIGFFIISNGYSYNNWGRFEGGEFKFIERGTDEIATLNSSHPELVHVSDVDVETTIRYHSYHSAAHGDSIGLNADGNVTQSDGSVGLLHTVGSLNVQAGTLTIGFEDLYNGGDKDFDDTVFTVDIGTANAEVLNAHAYYGNSGGGEVTIVNGQRTADAQDDVINGGSGSCDLSYVGVTNGEEDFAARFSLYNEDGFAGLLSGAVHQNVTFEVSIGETANWDRKVLVNVTSEGVIFTVQEWHDGILIGSQEVAGNLIIDGDNEVRLSVSQADLGIAIGDTVTWTARLSQEQFDAEGASLGVATDQFDSVKVFTLESSDDVLRGGTGDDTIFGYDGADILMGENDQDTLVSGKGDDVLYGGSGNDELQGGTGADALYGGNGTDSLVGGSGDDLIYGDKGDDHLIGQNGADTLFGGEGSDSLDGGTSNDVLYGEKHNDILNGGSGDDILYGGDQYDTLIGSIGNDRLYGGTHNDTLDGGKGDDILDGGDHHDTLTGGFGNDQLFGGTGNDTVDGGKGDDVLNLGAGNDIGFGSFGVDTISGGDGHDVLHLGKGDDVAYGDVGKDTINGDRGDDVIDGGADRDVLYGGRDNDHLSGGGDDDKLYGETGNDQLYGGDGTDFLDGGKNNDQLYGNADADLIRGSWGDDILYGGDGSDTLDGGDGEDVLIGGNGNDLYYGGKLGRADGDTDTFQMSVGGGADEIVGFEAAYDVVDLTAFNTTWLDVSAGLTDINGSAHLALSDMGGELGDSLLFTDFDHDDLDASHFIGLMDVY